MRTRPPIGDVERERVALGFADVAQLVADLEDRVDDLGVPLLAGAVAENRVELFVGHALAVRAVARHGVDRIGHGHDAGEQRRFLAFEAGRIAGAVPGFVMMAARRAAPCRAA